MPDAAPSPDQSLHLPSLVIKNFRGIDELTIPRLGRVTLLAGKNGVGKTTVLDAVRVWAARGRGHVLYDLLIQHDETVHSVGGDEYNVPNFDALFPNRRMYLEEITSIGSIHSADALQIRAVVLSGEASDEFATLMQSGMTSDEDMLGIEIKFQESWYRFPVRDTNPFQSWPQDGWYSFRHQPTSGIRRSLDIREFPPEVISNTMGPDVPDNATLERHFNEVALTPHEDRAIEALNLVTDMVVERVALVGTDTRSESRSGRKVLAKVRDHDQPTPLRSLGDGAVRLFALALALAKSSNGFLLIDEVENGIHHSVQASFWKMVLKTAQRNNVQVLATTHSSDCAYRFGQVASELEDIEGILYRIQRNGERLRAVPYPEDQLVIAAEHGIEVR